MFWTIDLMYAIVMASLAGAVITALWFWVGKLLERLGFLHILYDLLRAAAVFWFVPAAWLLEWYWIAWKLHQGIFMPSAWILKVAYVICIFWGLGTVVGLIRYLLQLRQNRRRVKAAVECERSIGELFAKTCADYGISLKRVRLLQSYGEDVPKVVGVLHPAVLLPVKKYTQDDLRVIFAHELTHIRQRDLLTKNLGLILCALHFWNPAVYWYVRLLNKWSEFSCDYRVCVREHNLKEYYGVIIAMLEETETVGLFSQLVENKSELRERMEHVMKCYQRGKNKRTRAAAVFIVGCMVLGSAGTIHAATRSGAKVMAFWAKVTEVSEEVPPQEQPVLVEYEAGPDFDTLVVLGEVEQLAGSTAHTLDWNVGGGTSVQSPLFWKQQGDTIEVLAMLTPDDLTVNIGIIKPDGNRVYVTDSSWAHHIFTSAQTGYYRVYIENRNTASVKATGSYR